MATLKNTTVDDTGYFQLPVGTTAQRPSSANTGMIRYNSTTLCLEAYAGETWQNITGAPGSIANPATSATQIKSAIGNLAVDGNYYYKPSGYSSSAIQCYTNFTNAPAGKGYVLVARGRESTDYWNAAGQNTTALLAANLTTNTPVAVAPGTFVSALGGNWSSMKILINRYYIGDSFYIQGTTSATFTWSVFNASPSSVAATLQRYTSNWKAGSLSYTATNTTGWTDQSPLGNDCSRIFTWTWSSHGGYQGVSAGSSCTTSGTFQYSTEQHNIDLASFYVEC